PGQVAALQEARAADTLKEGSLPGREPPHAATTGIVQQPALAVNTSEPSLQSEDIPTGAGADSLTPVPLEEFAIVEPPAAPPESESATAEQATTTRPVEAVAPEYPSPVMTGELIRSDLAEDIPAPEENTLEPVTLETFAQIGPLAQVDRRGEDTPDQQEIPMAESTHTLEETIPAGSQLVTESPLEEFAVAVPPPASARSTDTLPETPVLPEPAPSGDLAEDLPDAVTDLPAVALEEFDRVPSPDRAGEEMTSAAPERPALAQTTGPGEEIPERGSVPSDYGPLREFAQVDPPAWGEQRSGISPDQPISPPGIESQAVPGSSTGELTDVVEIPAREYPGETARDAWPINPGFDSALADGEMGTDSGVDTIGIPFFAAADYPAQETSLGESDPGTDGKPSVKNRSGGVNPPNEAGSQWLWTGIAISLILLILILIGVTRFILKRLQR
ncbi:MAG TPA: hypothetical protein VKA68_10355, partial [bacterium]|nr:hypothetical protein [bacterium]